MSFSWSEPYKPEGKLWRYLDDRLPIPRMIWDSVGGGYPVPKNLNYAWNFGALAGVALAVQILSGIILAMHYDGSAANAFQSVEHIMRDVNFGWMFRYIHANGASFFFIVVYIHIFRGLYYGSYKEPRELVWMLGVVILLLMMATAFMGYVLPWGQMSYWGATVITGLFSAIPIIGTSLQQWLLGGFSADTPTISRFFALHYILPFVILGTVVLKVWALHLPGSNNPLGIDVKGPQDTIPFHPYFTSKDGFTLVLYFMLFAIVVFFAPNMFGEVDNYIQANPLSTPAHIVPEWYLLPFYAILRSFTVDLFFIPAKLWGVLAMGSAILLLLFMPWLDGSPVRSNKFRPINRFFFFVLVVDIAILGVCGGKPAAEPWVRIAQLASAYYFAHFLIILPIVSRVERPLPVPRSISEAVLEKYSKLGSSIGSARGSMSAGAAVAPMPAE
ncbi:MAG: cytochrome b N-terminal domain-containing protein [Sphingomonadaceae bacterium]|nr:cytochrome b N-terminal domain-containing protein [Sphingomonadaceae bacterium]